MLHDLGRSLCFIGDTWHNRTQHDYWNNNRDCELLSLEECLNRPQQWWDKRQFMSCVSNIAFKKQVIDAVSSFSPAWFSVVNENSIIGIDVEIGYNSFINNFNVIYDGTFIGNHVTLTNFITISHDVQISDMCHVSPYSYLCFARINQGVCLAMRCTVPGKPNNHISICNWSNLLMDSRVTKSIYQTGTWYGSRKMDDQGSLYKKIL